MADQLAAVGAHEVAVVVLSYNGLHELRHFLPSVVAHSHLTRPGWQATVWVVDNASTDGTWAALVAEFPTVRRHRIEVNHGFAGGYIESLPHIAADLYVLINADVAVTPHWLEPLVDAFVADPLLMAAQPKILSQRQPTHFEYSGAGGGYLDYLGYPFCRGRLFFELEPDEGQYDDAREVFWASGACMAIRHTAYHGAGGFDPTFYAHMEEIDLCWRLKNQGYRVGYVPQSVVYHVGGHIIRYGSPAKMYYNYRNGLAMLVKNLRGRGWWRTVVLRMVLDGISGVRSLLRGRPQDTWAILRAHAHFYRRLPATLGARRRLITDERRRNATPNLTGLYRRSLVWQYFGRKVARSTDLPGLQQ